MRLRLLDPGELVAGLATALAGGAVIAPRCEPRLEAALHLDEPVAQSDAAVVVATSGSTGEPKAVVLSAEAISFSATATHRRLGGAGDWVCALPTYHIAGLMTLARAVVAGTEPRFARPDLADLPTASGRAYLSLVAAQLHRALAEPAVVERLRSYAAVLIGGSAIPPGLREAAAAAGVTVVVTYGMSETCGGCVYDRLPLDGVRVELAGERVGLAGPMAFLGYRCRPDLTAAVLDGDLVRTHDRGRMTGGRLEILGRLDEVVISGGEKVDLAAAQRVCDVEFGEPASGGLVLLGLPDPRWGTRIVAVTIGRLDLAQVRARLLPLLGRAALPRELRSVDRLAYTSIGKIDRAVLLHRWQEEGNHGDGG